MNEINTLLTEHDAITTELKRLRKSITALGTRRREIESGIVDIIKRTNHDGIRLPDRVIEVVSKERRKRVTDKSKRTQLRNLGFDHHTIDKIMYALTGPTVDTQTGIKIDGRRR